MSERQLMPWYWERDDKYRWNGKCCYADLCEKYNDQCNPEECADWESFFDGEVSAEEAMESL